MDSEEASKIQKILAENYGCKNCNDTLCKKISIFIKFDDTKKIQMHHPICISIYELKEQIYEKEDIHPIQQRLAYQGRVLLDEEKLSNCKIVDRSTLYLIRALRGD